MSRRPPPSPPKRQRVEDPVVREVRDVRARLWEEGGRSIEGYFRRMAEISKVRSKGGAGEGRRRKSA